MRKLFFVIFIALLSFQQLFCQDKYTQLQEKLTSLSTGDIPALNEKVNISVTNVSVQEFLRGVANNTGLNINVSPDLKIEVVNNFSNVRVMDILLFLCKQYNLSVSVIGNIINVYKEEILAEPEEVKQLAKYDRGMGLLSIECTNEDLSNVAKEIVLQTGLNVVPAPGLDKIKVSSYVQNMPIDNALDKLAYANNLKIRKTDDQVYLIEKNEPIPVISTSNTSQQRKEKGSNKKNGPNTHDDQNLEIKVLNRDSISITAENASIEEIVREVASKLNIDYFLTSDIQGEATFTLRAVSYPSLLKYLLANTNYSFQKMESVYLIGENKGRDMKSFKVFQFQNRTMEKILEHIPSELTKELELKEFPELNAILIGGLPSTIQTLETFLRSLDKVIPVILIEVMIIDLKNTHLTTTGIDMGLGDKPAVTKGSVFPGVDMTLSSQSINNLLNSFNGFGSLKIGKVTPNFYMNLKFLESNGVINIRSTPKLSTLNGHEASMSIGNKEYYVEEQNSIYGSLSAQSTTIKNYKPVTAELSVKIKPVVSGDDQITLDIEVNQGDFTDRITQNAPPGEVSRKFKSLIRVKNQEMVLLGGLEEKSTRETGSGVPLLSRLPILKWIFGSKSRNQTNAKLNIFIKSTIIE